MELVIAGGKVVDGGGVRRADVLVRGGRIAAVAPSTPAARRAAGRTLDARGCLVLPGAVDPHVHLALPIGGGTRTADDFDSGTRAAAAGGVTTLLDYTTPAADQAPLAAFRARRAQADRTVRVDYGLHNVLIGWRPGWRAELARLARLGAPSVKLFTIYRDRGWQADDGRMLEVMQACREAGLTVCVHAENDSLIELFTRRALALPAARRPWAAALALARPPLAEQEAVARAIFLAAATGARLHLVHLSTAGAARAVGLVRAQGLRVSGETCPQYLALDARALGRRGGHRFGCCPPLRSPGQASGLLEALRQGWLQALATDHCSFTSAQKDVWGGDFRRIPYGLPGLETALRLTFTLGPAARALPLARWVSLHTEGPARLFGLYPRKGSLEPGADADLVVFDPSASRRLRARDLETPLDWSPYEGMQLRGEIRHVLLRGQEVAREGRCLDTPPRGRYLRRSPAPA
ncbi:MAG TPA: amidohydrolase family protein [Myxococcota bacterium]|nr:amidohydrolase family protein [Myxococcota bacterium]HRY92296.1 amidohydrolase family protein [Myxococcota bacterium]HSA23625.1 amidohydrolase family protein [Myxococcota bacterium]